jgi:Methylamine utilisation protein MauE
LAASTAEIASAGLALAFGFAALAKLVLWSRWQRSLAVHRLPDGVLGFISIAVPAAELAVAALIVLVSATVGAAFALVLLAGFSLAVARARSLAGRRLPCGCFGTTGERDWRALVARNAGLIFLAAWGVAAGGDDALLAEVDTAEPGELFAAALTLAGIALAVWTARTTRTELRR